MKYVIQPPKLSEKEEENLSANLSYKHILLAKHRLAVADWSYRPKVTLMPLVYGQPLKDKIDIAKKIGITEAIELGELEQSIMKLGG